MVCFGLICVSAGKPAFTCENGEQIEAELVCNGLFDCEDQSDEETSFKAEGKDKLKKGCLTKACHEIVVFPEERTNLPCCATYMEPKDQTNTDYDEFILNTRKNFHLRANSSVSQNGAKYNFAKTIDIRIKKDGSGEA